MRIKAGKKPRLEAWGDGNCGVSARGQMPVESETAGNNSQIGIYLSCALPKCWNSTGKSKRRKEERREG